MTRLISTMKWDTRLQWRNGFYYAALVVVVIWSLLVSQIPQRALQELGGGLAWLLPIAVLGNLLIGTFYFIGGLLLLEKGEGTLEAQIVTPLRTNEYLISKLSTLTLLSLLENSLLVGIITIFRSPFESEGGWAMIGSATALMVGIILFIAALVVGALILCLFGFLVVIRYDSINEYLLPSILITTLLMLPLATYLAGWFNPLLYLHPVQAPLTLFQAAWQTLPVWEILYGLLYGLIWVGLLFHAARKAFYRFVIAKQGAKR